MIVHLYHDTMVLFRVQYLVKWMKFLLLFTLYSAPYREKRMSQEELSATIEITAVL